MIEVLDRADIALIHVMPEKKLCIWREVLSIKDKRHTKNKRKSKEMIDTQ